MNTISPPNAPARRPRWTLHALTTAALALAAPGCGGGGGGGASTAGADGGVDATADAGKADGAGHDAAQDAAAADAGLDTAADAGAADADAGGDGATACTAPALGRCQGAVLSWCDEGVDRTFDCASDGDQPMQCARVDATWGHDCLVPPGGDCALVDDDGAPSWGFCAGKAPGCVVGPALEARCLEDRGPCQESAIGTCAGTVATLDCAGGQPWLIDCGALGASCAAEDGDAWCEGVDKGGLCDDALLFCADGLSCVVPAGAAAGACQ
jgi:hypothetical protein